MPYKTHPDEKYLLKVWVEPTQYLQCKFRHLLWMT